MKLNSNKHTTSTSSIVPGKQRNYTEIVQYLDAHWKSNLQDSQDLSTMKMLDKAFHNVASESNSIIIAGSNGKSITAHFASKLLQEEGLNVGTFFSPHFMNYNERFTIQNESISNKAFTDLANEVINTSESLGLEANSYAILTMMAFLHFDRNGVDVSLIEADQSGYNATAICKPKVVAITRLSDPEAEINDEDIKELVEKVMVFVDKDSYVVSADQSKSTLHIMNEMVEAKGGIWVMPLRKLANLEYPFKQLHGRCAALAERLAFIFINHFANKDAILVDNSILTKQKGHRGRPTLAAKKERMEKPKRTTEHFWKETVNTLPGRFQIFEKDKPTVLLDTASNIDAFKNILLGARLLHYAKPVKGLAIILGCNNESINIEELLRELRYFFKKTSGSIVICPVEPQPGHHGTKAWDVEKVTNNIKSMMKVKASRAAHSFAEAFEAAQTMVDDRNGLIIVTGSPSIISEYWKYKGIKKV